MNATAVDELSEAIDLCLQARALLDPHASSRVRLMLDALLFRLGTELALALLNSEH